MFITLGITILPSLLIAAFIILSDKYREPPLQIIYAFSLGFVIIFPAGILNYYLIFSHENSKDLVFIAGFTEESIKFLTLLLFLRNRPAFDEPMDAIVYATLLSLGFATLENFDYVYFLNQNYSSLSIAIIRALTAIPLHACCGIIMGYFFGLYFFKRSRISFIASILLPILVHSFYNYLTKSFYVYICIIIVIIFAFALHNICAKSQKKYTYH